MEKEISSKGIGEAIGTLIAKLCYKAADELGADLAERTGDWRRQNALKILSKANQKYEQISSSGNESAPPRLVHHIIEEGSWNDQEHVQNMWAGLLASACTDSGQDESNLIFINILKQLTCLEVTVLNHVCEKCRKGISSAGWLYAHHFEMELNDLIKLTKVDDIHRLDRELDHRQGVGADQQRI